MKISIKKDGPSVLVGAFVPVGSRGEDAKIKGVSHFLEHMMFKGTKTRDKYTLKRDVEKYGAIFNAWTSEEHTFYYINIGTNYANVARDIIHDMMNNSVFPEEEVANEREVILQELQMYEDNPQSHVFELANKALYGESSGMHLPIIGTRETLAELKRDNLAEYYKVNYANPVYLEVGDTKEERNKIELPKKFSFEVANKDKSDCIVSRKGINQANMVLTGLLHFEDLQKGTFILDFYSDVMNGFCGRLFDVVREKNHLVYNVSFYCQELSCGTAQYGVYAALDADKIDKARELIVQEMNRPVEKEEIEFVRNKYVGRQQLALDSQSYIGRTAINSTINHLNYDSVLLDYEKNIDEAKTKVNDFIKMANFADSKLIAIVPEK